MTGNGRGTVYTTPFTAWTGSLERIITAAGLKSLLSNAGPTILIKPNLVEALPPPITTPVQLVAALVALLKDITTSDIVIGEGSGAAEYETGRVFDELGYTDMARQYGIGLVDLNDETSVKLENSACLRWPVIYLPRIALESFLISVPVLKAHTLAGVTLTMKNMLGLAPPHHYRRGGRWKKAAFHDRIQDAIADLNRYRTPDFTLLDATVGMARAHLWGPACDPPVNRLAAGWDPVAMDAYGAGLLNKKWYHIGHISKLNGELGQADPLHVIHA